jgi:hypothetical protein
MTKRTALYCAAGIALIAATSCSQEGGQAMGAQGGINATGGTPAGGGDTGSPMGGATDTSGGGAGGSAAGGVSQQDTSAGGGGGDTGGSVAAGGSNTSSVGNGGTSAPNGGTKAAGGTTAAGGSGTKAGGGTTAAGGSGTKAVGGTTAAGGTTTAPATGTKATGGAATGGSGTKATGGAATGGATTAAAGSTSITPADIVPDLASGFYWEGTCSGSIAVTGHNCPMADTCPSSGIDRPVTKNVAGVTGQTYTVTIEVRGVIGTRCYKNGTRASTAAGSDTGTNNWWYIGGVYDNPTGWWNSYELHVAPSTGDPSGDVYYFNGSDVGGGNWCEKEATYLVKYNASFKVKGGGTLTFKIHDQNCKAQQNCGSNIDPNSACAPRTVDLSGMTPQPPASFRQPPTNNITTGTFDPQWMWIVATKVTSP